ARKVGGGSPSLTVRRGAVHLGRRVRWSLFVAVVSRYVRRPVVPVLVPVRGRFRSTSIEHSRYRAWGQVPESITKTADNSRLYVSCPGNSYTARLPLAWRGDYTRCDDPRGFGCPTYLPRDRLCLGGGGRCARMHGLGRVRGRDRSLQPRHAGHSRLCDARPW